MPQRAAEQQLDQRLQPVRTLLPCPQFLARHARQVDDWRPILRKTRLFEGAIHDAAHPDRGTGAPFGAVVAQDEVLVDALQEQVDQRQPLALRVGPQDGGRPRLTVERRVPGAEARDQAVEDRVGRRRRSGMFAGAHDRGLSWRRLCALCRCAISLISRGHRAGCRSRDGSGATHAGPAHIPWRWRTRPASARLRSGPQPRV